LTCFPATDSLSRKREKRNSRRANGSIEIWPNNIELPRENDVREDFDSRNHDHEVEPALTRSPSGIGKIISLLNLTSKLWHEIT
jgi:hypothetical protein